MHRPSAERPNIISMLNATLPPLGAMHRQRGRGCGRRPAPRAESFVIANRLGLEHVVGGRGGLETRLLNRRGASGQGGLPLDETISRRKCVVGADAVSTFQPATADFASLAWWAPGNSMPPRHSTAGLNSEKSSSFARLFSLHETPFRRSDRHRGCKAAACGKR